jgi:hypothetical protein
MGSQIAPPAVSGWGWPWATEKTAQYSNPLTRLAEYLISLDAAGIPRGRAGTCCSRPEDLEMAAQRWAGAVPICRHSTEHTPRPPGTGQDRLTQSCARRPPPTSTSDRPPANQIIPSRPHELHEPPPSSRLHPSFVAEPVSRSGYAARASRLARCRAPDPIRARRCGRTLPPG